jgi:hypothetical protein
MTPKKIIVRTPLIFKKYLKLDGARPMSKIFDCPIVTVAGRTSADITIFRFFREIDVAICGKDSSV